MNNPTNLPDSPIIVPMEDELVHTPENDYQCDDLTCPCHAVATSDEDEEA